MSSPGTRPTDVTPADADRADATLHTWATMAEEDADTVGAWRGLLIAAFADCRHDAYADALADYRAADTDPAGKPGG